MAIKPDKKGKVTGTKKAEKITWSKSKDQAKALTVNAGAGNDKIYFAKSKYKNKLNGEAGNDTISQLASDVAGWISTNTGFTSVSDLLANGSEADITALFAEFDKANWTSVQNFPKIK